MKRVSTSFCRRFFFSSVAMVLGVSQVNAQGEPASGLDRRPPNPSCVLLERPTTARTGYTIVKAFRDLSLPSTVALFQAPGDPSTWYSIERRGRIHAFENDPDVKSRRTFLDLRSRLPDWDSTGERGLKAIAFHPEWADNGEAIVSYVTPKSLEWFVSRLRSTDGGETLNPNTEEVLLHEVSEEDFHLSGQPRFGPDGYLYLGIGDFGESGYAQDTDVLQGSMLRIDVDRGAPYAIPGDNPFAAGGGAPELFAWGLRQPWGWSFDRLTGDIWVGDVGKESREEINRVVRGGNYGWPLLEGTKCQRGDCDDAEFIPPVADFTRDEARCIIGGYVYRGAAIPELFGAYIFGDWSGKEVYALHFEGRDTPRRETLGDTDGESVLWLAEDHLGEIYIVTSRQIFKLVPEEEGAAQNSFPQLLSQLPCVDASAPSQPTAAMIPYEINAPFWSDDADKTRWLAVPDGETIHVDEAGDWEFPVGTTLLKHFRLNGRMVETRLFVRHGDGGWGGYSYEWNEQQTDAVLLESGKTTAIAGQLWDFPSRGDCLGCHTAAAGHALGPETAQMNRLTTYPTTGRTANQLATFEHIGLFSEPLGASPAELPRLVDPLDETAALEERARSYLHANCSHCHRPENAIPVAIDLRSTTPFDQTRSCSVEPRDALGVAGARIVLPGDPSRSIISLRMRSAADGRMPPIGSNAVDPLGTDLIDAWINSLDSCEGRGPRFRRGDANQDQAHDIADAVFILIWLFDAGARPRCVEALNVNGDARVDISDGTSLLTFLFLGGTPPPAPFPDCGASEELLLGCESPSCP